MLFRMTVTVCLLVGTWFSTAGADEIDVLRMSLATTTDPATQARIQKKIGDAYTANDDYRRAAGPYLQALVLQRKGFAEAERLEMIKVIAWGGDHAGALGELQPFMADYPANAAARLLYAKVLAWSGRFTESIAEAEALLREDPDNRDALLVKANALRWQGSEGAAIPIYRKLLEGGEDFDTRLGLAYALLAKGDRGAARKSSALLVAKSPYQEKELKAFKEELARTTASQVDLRYSYYNDTDDNTVNRYGVGFSTDLAMVRAGLDYRHTDARDPVLHTSADDFSARASAKLAGLVEVGAGAGFTQTHSAANNTFFTGNARAVFDLLNGTAGIGFSRDIFTDTAQIIDNRIRVYNTTVFISQKLADRLLLLGSYSYRDYSDDNSANDLQLSPVYTLLRGNPSLNVGYRFRYLDFARQSGHGYFDPNSFFSNGIFLSGSYARGGYYLYLEPYGGYQQFWRNGVYTNGMFGAISGNTGYRIGSHLAVEVNGEFGNYAGQTASGFKYHQVGALLRILF